MVNDTIADLLTRIRNAQLAGHPSVRVPLSKMAGWILEVLRKEGFIAYFEKVAAESGPEQLEVGLKYFRPGMPLIASLRRVSSPGRRIYLRADRALKVRSGLGIAVLSTSQGVMSDREARQRKIGGEVLAIVA
jgi:small subunit ribosomal protein S8